MKNKSLLQKFGLAGFAFFLLKGLVWLAIGGAALPGFTSKNDSPMAKGYYIIEMEGCN
ncbi:MAG: hypothetical protein EPGJADBJ_04348 [Saprospiraceae bacterium]|nr:hypothetical protein [Saprospiraceae bacterium]